jgi:hypothetical protein
MVLIDLTSDDMGEALDAWYDGCLADESYTGLLDSVRRHFLGDGLTAAEDVCVGSIAKIGGAWHLIFAKRYQPDGTVILGLSEWHAVPARISWYPAEPGSRWLTSEPF